MKNLLLFFITLLASGSEQVDLTITPNAAGSYIVEAVVAIIQEKCVFEDDKLFLRRMAYVETNDGTDANTYASGYFGGIWKVDNSKYTQTKSVSSAILTQVTQQYGINWASTTWNDLLKPLYSGLAARLYMQYKKENGNVVIPNSLSGQSTYWATHITSSASPNAANFVTVADTLPQICKVVADVAFLVDGSGSISTAEYNLMKGFLKKVVAELNIGPDISFNSRVSTTVFSGNVVPQFDFDDCSTLACYENKFNTLIHPGNGTYTHLGLDYMTTNTFLTSKGVRTNLPRIVVVLTDGASQSTALTTTASNALLATNVKVFAVGVGDGIKINELKIMASDPDCNYYSVLTNFNDFDGFVKQIEKRVCNVPTEINGTTTVIIDGIKYLYYTLSSSCHIIGISSMGGNADIYYSTTYQPGPARYDGTMLVTPTTPGYLYSSLTTGTLHIAAVAASNVQLTFTLLPNGCTCPGCLVPVASASGLFECIQGSYTTTSVVITTGGGYTCANSPCNPLVTPMKFHYPHVNPNKFVQCSEWGQCYEMPCPSGLRWNDAIQVCSW